MKGATEIKSWKKDSVKDVSKMMDEYKIVAVVNFNNLPAKQLQKMRENLRETVLMKMTKKTLIKLALKNSKKENIGELEPYLRGMPALLFSNENPFKLFSFIKKNKSKAPIKGGQEAPNDIIVPAGGTDFAPGPLIGELGAFGIQTGVEGGKISIKNDAVVAKEGETVSQTLAGLLTRLGIEPMDVGLDLVAVYEEGEILTKSVLDIDEEEFAQNFKTAAAWAFNLAFNAGFPTEETINLMISQGHRDALALAQSQDILTDETVKTVLAKAEAQATALQVKVPDTPVAAPAEKVEEKVEETPAEPEAKEEKTEAPVEVPAEPAETEKTEEKAEETVEEKKEEVEKTEESAETSEEKKSDS